MSPLRLRSSARPSLRTACFGAVALVTLWVFPAVAIADDSSDDRPGRYLIVLHDSVRRPKEVAAEHERRHAAEVSHVYRHAINGYAAELPEEAVEGISRDPRVAWLEPDREVSTFAQTIPTGIRRAFATSNAGLDVDGADDVRVDVDVAIIDTGIDLDHPDLNVVASAGCIVTGSFDGCVDGTGEDDNGHGTHVAGTTAAIDNDFGVVGVAPGARLHAVKVLTASGAGLISDVIAGVDWVTARADTIEVANMSLGCRCAVATLDQAIAASVDRGVVYVVAAGNNGEDAKTFSPASQPDVITVSALADFDGLEGGGAARTCRTDEDDTLGNFSNWGPEVEVAASGVCILSTSLLGGYSTLSGTSMASPHVAGAAAVLTSGANDPQSGADVAAVRDAIIGSGNFNWFDDSGDGIREPLLDVGDPQVFVVNSSTRTMGGDPPPSPDNDQPVASFTDSCSGLDCSFDGSGSKDSDGTISSYAWDFGDGTTGSGATAGNTYDASGTYTVVLTVTDDRGATATASRNVTVSSAGGGSGGNDPGSFRLSGFGARAVGKTTAYLEWYGTDRVGTIVIYRNGEAIATTADDGSYTDVIENSAGSYTYKVCEEGTTRCSNEMTLF